MSAPNITLVIESLADGIPAITASSIGFYKDNCMVCFNDQSHESGVQLRVVYNDDPDLLVAVRWDGDVTQQLIRAYGDKKKAADFAACAIALLLIRELTEFTAVEQSSIGTTVDYYLSRKDALQDDTLIFNNTARLEVSGILQENSGNSVGSRFGRKIRRLKSEGDLSDFIIVVEFSDPWSKMVRVEA